MRLLLALIVRNINPDALNMTTYVALETERAVAMNNLASIAPTHVKWVLYGRRQSQKFDFVSSLFVLLNRVREAYVFYVQEDFLPVKPILHDTMKSIIQVVGQCQPSVAYLWQRTPCAPPRQCQVGSIFTQSLPPRWYSHQIAIWRRNYLQHTLQSPSDGSSWSQETSFDRPLGESFWHRHRLHDAKRLCIRSTDPRSGLRDWGSFAHLGATHNVEEEKLLARIESSLGPNVLFKHGRLQRASHFLNFSHYVNPRAWRLDRNSGLLTTKERLEVEHMSRLMTGR